MNDGNLIENRERVIRVHSGSTMLVVVLAIFAASVATIIYAFRDNSHPNLYLFFGGIIGIALMSILSRGFFTLQPNEARVLILFGHYKGTVRESGFHWGNPFYANGSQGMMAEIADMQRQAINAKAGVPTVKHKSSLRNKVSLRARTLNVERLKVNDKQGNPIEIAAVVVWRVRDTAQAVFDVDDFESYVEMQSESALRHLASAYSYDHGEENDITLRSNVDEVSKTLQKELEQRLIKAGIAVEETRLTHLAYAPEIAQAMLRRQQAEAVIAAREKIVHGAVSMVDMALKDLAAKKVVQLDDERRAAMVSNLMVVLCGEAEVHPVVNTGTLYS